MKQSHAAPTKSKQSHTRAEVAMFHNFLTRMMLIAALLSRGQVEALGGEEVLKNVDLGPIPLPDVEKPPHTSDILRQVCVCMCAYIYIPFVYDHFGN